MLQHFSPYVHPLLIGINFFLIPYFAWKCRLTIIEAVREIPWPYYAGLAGMVMGLFFLYSFLITPKHYMYTDFMFERSARDVLTQGHFGDLMKSQGWAFIIFLGYLFAGVNDHVSIYLAEILGSASVIVFFLLAVWVGADRYAAFLSTMVFAFIPARLFWAATGESHTALLFFVILAMAFSFFFYHNPQRSSFWLALMTWAFAVQVRGETVFLMGLFFFGIRSFLPVEVRRQVPFRSGLIIAACLIVPQLLLGAEFYAAQLSMAERSHGIGTLNFFIIHNLVKFTSPFLMGEAHPFILSLMAGLGMVRLTLKDRKLSIFLFSWLFLLTMVYFSMFLDIYGGGKGFFPKMRLLEFFYPPLLLFFAFSFGRPALWPIAGKMAVAAAVCAGIILWSIPSYRDHVLKYYGIQAQMEIIDYAESSIPQKDIIVTCAPEILTATSYHYVVSAADFINDPRLRGRIFVQADKTAGRVLLLETLIGKNCRESGMYNRIMKLSRAVPIKTFSKGSAHFSIEQLSAF